jgi:hypothetical protein
MLKNLLKTWAELAPDEIELKEGGEYVFTKTIDWTFYPEIVSIYDSFFEEPYTKDMLQGYTQRCIHTRGWYFSLEQLPDYSKADVRTKVEDQPHQCGKYKDACHEVLLIAYLNALTSQLPIHRGVWRHFKGDVVEVVGIFPFGTRDCDDDDYTEEGLFTFEDDPALSFQLICWGDGYMEFQHTALSLGFLPPRVAYRHDGKGFLRTPDNFLSLVGPEHAEDEGLLRFTK